MKTILYRCRCGSEYTVIAILVKGENTLRLAIVDEQNQPLTHCTNCHKSFLVLDFLRNQ